MKYLLIVFFLTGHGYKPVRVAEYKKYELCHKDGTAIIEKFKFTPVFQDVKFTCIDISNSK